MVWGAWYGVQGKQRNGSGCVVRGPGKAEKWFGVCGMGCVEKYFDSFEVILILAMLYLPRAN